MLLLVWGDVNMYLCVHVCRLLMHALSAAALVLVDALAAVDDSFVRDSLTQILQAAVLKVSRPVASRTVCCRLRVTNV